MRWRRHGGWVLVGAALLVVANPEPLALSFVAAAIGVDVFVILLALQLRAAAGRCHPAAVWLQLVHGGGARQLLQGGLLLALSLACIDAVRAADCPPQPAAPTPAQLQDARSRDRGLLWTLDRDGRRSWLYATLHVGRAEWAAPGPKVAAALAASSTLALEIDPADPAAAGALSAPGTPSQPALPAPVQARLSRQLSAACLGADAMRSMSPTLQVMVLALVQARWEGLDAGFGQEQVLARAARAAGKPVVALESVGLQAKALLPADPAEGVRTVEQTLEQIESGSGRSTIARLARAWEDGDLALLSDDKTLCDGCIRNAADRAALQALNDARNPALADGIAALHAQGRPVFAAVGALHMTGAAALPRLLAARGFTVGRVPLRP